MNKLKNISVILLLILSLFIISTRGYSQNTKITLNLNKVRLEEALERIEKLTNFNFFVNTEQIDIDRVVSVKAKGEKVSKILDMMDISFKIFDKQIILNNGGNATDKSNLQIVINGKVTDSNGTPLLGVSVTEKNTTNGVITDFYGSYSIELSSDKPILVFSYISQQTQEILVGEKITINIQMKEDIDRLDEVVVVGYGSQKKSDITGSLFSLPIEKVQKLPIVRADQALQGRAAGVVVQSTDASPKSSTTIRIRGANSINGGNDPLVIIDGLQGADLSVVNPSDIKSMEVLKDASATSVYGSRGSNGVILITTKGGLKGQKPTVNYNAFFSLHTIRKKIDLLKPLQYAETVNAKRQDNGLSNIFSNNDLNSFKVGEGTDWQDEIFRLVTSQNHNISLSGGGDKISYFISGNVLDRGGILRGTSYDRFSLRSNVAVGILMNILH